jgi:hypothetical protein
VSEVIRRNMNHCVDSYKCFRQNKRVYLSFFYYCCFFFFFYCIRCLLTINVSAPKNVLYVDIETGACLMFIVIVIFFSPTILIQFPFYRIYKYIILLYFTDRLPCTIRVTTNVCHTREIRITQHLK